MDDFDLSITNIIKNTLKKSIILKLYLFRFASQKIYKLDKK